MRYVSCRGSHDGFGVYLAPSGDRYVGQWMSGKKHGTGRYTFANGDFYDGKGKVVELSTLPIGSRSGNV